MPLAPSDIKAIAEMKTGTIDQFCRKIYARLRRLLVEGSANNKLSYEAMWGTWLCGLVRTIPIALEFRDLCATVASGPPAEEFRTAMEQASRMAETIALQTGVMLSFEETSSLRIALEHWHWELRFQSRLRKYEVVWTMEEVDSRAARLREPLSVALLANGFDAERAKAGSYALARLAASCESFVEETEELLKSRTRPQIYAAASFIFALIVELYARSFEFEYVFNVARMA